MQQGSQCVGEMGVYGMGKVRGAQKGANEGDIRGRWVFLAEEMGCALADQAGCAVICAGLFRVRGFTQDDGHIFCLPGQISGEIRGVLDLVEEVLGGFGFSDLEVRSAPLVTDPTH